MTKHENEAAPVEENRPEYSTKEAAQKEESDGYFDTTLHGGCLDRLLYITKFPSIGAKSKTETNRSLRELAAEIADTFAAAKEKLPWLKLASFGDERTEKGSFRSNSNTQGCDGIEIDYDAGIISIHEAGDRIRAAGLAYLLYSTPSSTAEEPRWRALLPFSRTLPPSKQGRHVARANGVLGGVIDGASFTLSQSYYFGNVLGQAPIDVLLGEGRAIDLADDLDAGALNKRGQRWREAQRLPRRARVRLPEGQDGTFAGLRDLEGACQRVAGAMPGQQELTLRDACYQVGRLAAEGCVNDRFATLVLAAAASKMMNASGREPWTLSQIASKILRAMEAAS